MRGTEITVEILTLSLSKGGDFGPTAYFATGPIQGKQDFCFASPSKGKLSGRKAGLMGWEPPPYPAACTVRATRS